MAKLTREQKQEEVTKLAELFKQAKAAIFAVYRGLSVREMTELRGQLREKGIDFKVVKTNLAKRALEQDKLPVPLDDVLSQPIAVAISYDDEVTPAKILFEVAKASEKLAMLAGIVDGKLVDGEFLKTVAQLPGREELIARMVDTLANLPRRLVFSLQYPTNAFTNIMRQYQSQEGS